MKRRNLLESIPAFIASLFVCKKLNADKTTASIGRTNSAGLPVANAYVAILMSCVERAREGSKVDLDCINMTFDESKKSFFKHYHINPKEGIKPCQMKQEAPANDAVSQKC